MTIDQLMKYLPLLSTLISLFILPMLNMYKRSFLSAMEATDTRLKNMEKAMTERLDALDRHITSAHQRLDAHTHELSAIKLQLEREKASNLTLFVPREHHNDQIKNVITRLDRLLTSQNNLEVALARHTGKGDNE